MATLKRDPSTVAALSGPPSFSATQETEEGVLRSALEGLHRVVVGVVDRINGLLSLGPAKHGAWAGNLDAQWMVDLVWPAGSTSLEVPHGLGRVPAGVLPVLTKNSSVGVEEIRPDLTQAWTQDVVYLTRTRTADAWTVSVLVF